MPDQAQPGRAHWTSSLGFVLAAVGSAVGLGNIWKFPYITGENGGGAFVLVYLGCILLVGVPVMIGEILLGRTTRSSPVRAFRGEGVARPWQGVGLIGVVAAFLLMSYYSTVAGWTLHFTYLSVTNQIAGASAEKVTELFEALTSNAALGLFWQMLFIALAIWMVASGVSRGIERCARIMMPGLFALLLVLLFNAMSLSGWGQSVDFLFSMRFDSLTAAGALEALGHSFFTLSLGMGAMITYGSYLSRKDDLVTASVATAGADTLVAIVASLVIFPIVFTFGLEPGAGPGLLFVTIPTALAQMTGGTLLSLAFFVMLLFGALTSGIAMIEVLVAHLIDEYGMTRRRATLFGGLAVALTGIPATVSAIWFDRVDYLVSNWLLPLGGLGVAVYVAWRMDRAIRQDGFQVGSAVKGAYSAWLWILRIPVPISIAVVFLWTIGVIQL